MSFATRPEADKDADTAVDQWTTVMHRGRRLSATSAPYPVAGREQTI